MRIEINPGDRQLAFILLFTAVVLAVGIAGAYTANSSSDPTGAQPALMGHSADEVDLRPLHIDTTNSRVGIGTTMPVGNLDVVGNIVLGSTTELGGEAIRIRWENNYFLGANADALIIEKTDDDPTIEGGMVLGFATSPAFNTERTQAGWAVNHTPVVAIRPNGRVGIGTKEPTRKLELSGTTTGLKITDTAAAGNAFVELSTVNGGSSYFQNTGGRTKIYVGGGERMTFLTNGNVGIGTTNPSQKLDVAGQIHATGDICTDQGGGTCLSTAAGGGSLVCVSRSISQNQICDTICSNSGEVCTGSGDSQGVVAIACHSPCPWVSCGFCRCCKIQ